MGFKKYVATPYPKRQWSLVSHPGDGKSTLAARMQTPNVVVDADHRFDEVAGLANGDVFPLSQEVGLGNTDARMISDQLLGNMDKSIKTITVDSLSAIIEILVTRGMMDNDAGDNKNRASAWKEKALSMRLIQNSITQWGTDTLWIYHYRDGGDSRGRPVKSTTITSIELAKLQRSLNMNLEIVRDGERRGIKVLWARSGRSGMTIWDEKGFWEDMPELIEAAVYDGLTAEDMAKIANAVPTRFASQTEAIAWAIGLEGADFKDAQHARNAYEKQKREGEPADASEMWSLWIAYVLRRVDRNSVESDGNDEEE